MRYYFGFGVGHTYCHHREEMGDPSADMATEETLSAEDETDMEGNGPGLHQSKGPVDDDSESINSMDRGIDSDDALEEPDDTVEDNSDDDEFEAMDEMYGEE